MQVPHEVEHPRLGRPVRRPADEPGLQGGHRAHRHDGAPAVLDHARQHGLGQGKHARQVHVDHGLPLVKRHPAGVTRLARVAGIVDQDVHASLLLDHPLRERAALDGLGHVGLAGHGLAARLLDLGDDGVEGRAAAARHHHVRAFRGEHERRRSANAGSRPCDNRDLPIEPSHEVLLIYRQAQTGCSKWSTRVDLPRATTSSIW